VNVHDDVEAFALGALDPGDERLFRDHLGTCALCRDAVAGYVVVMSSLRSISQDGAPPVPSVRSRTYWREAIAAVLVLGAVGGTFAYTQRPDGDLAAIASIVADHPREIALTGPRASGSVVVGARGQRTAFIVRGLPAPAPGRGYQVWVRAAHVSSPGMLHRTRDGLEVLIVPGDVVRNAHRIGITIEPAGGSPKRSGPTQVSAEV